MTDNNPPTERQIERIHALLGHPRVSGEWLDSMMREGKMEGLLRTSKGAGALISILKKRTGWDGKSPLD